MEKCRGFYGVGGGGVRGEGADEPAEFHVLREYGLVLIDPLLQRAEDPAGDEKP